LSFEVFGFRQPVAAPLGLYTAAAVMRLESTGLNVSVISTILFASSTFCDSWAK